MPQKPEPRACVDVAIAAVVDKMSPDGTNASRSHGEPSPRPGTGTTQRVLITRRKAEQVLGGYWELPGGKVEPGESAHQAVTRELQEEVGIQIEPVLELDQVEHHYDHARVRLIPFICRWVTGKPRALEVDEVRWVALNDLHQYRFPQASLPVIHALLHRLRHADKAHAKIDPRTDTAARPQN